MILGVIRATGVKTNKILYNKCSKDIDQNCIDSVVYGKIYSTRCGICTTIYHMGPLVTTMINFNLSIEN